MTASKVFVCKKCKNARCLTRVLKRSDARVVLVGCQKICAGPVAGVKVDGKMEWFTRVDTAKRIAGLWMLLQKPKKRPVKALEARRLPKRSGRSPR